MEETKHKVTVYNREDFEALIESDVISYHGLDSPRIIEIYSGPCGKPVMDKDLIEGLPKQIITLDFEDFAEDVRFPGNVYRPTNRTTTYADAERLVKFSDYGMKFGFDFIIHSDAGVSRSQQVAEYILMMGRGTYVYDDENSTHTHHFSQTIVLSRLLEVKHKTIPDFRDKNDEFVYDSILQSWVLR